MGMIGILFDVPISCWRMPKNRIDTSGNQTPLGGMAGAFSGMNLPELPAGAETKAPEKPAEPLWKMGRVVLRKEKAHRGGKTVIVVDDFATHLPASVIENVAKKLRAACGCGGTVKERRIEMQGDQPSKVRALLEAEGFQVAGIR
jgi:translation initiation factor 1